MAIYANESGTLKNLADDGKSTISTYGCIIPLNIRYEDNTWDVSFNTYKTRLKATAVALKNAGVSNKSIYMKVKTITLPFSPRLVVITHAHIQSYGSSAQQGYEVLASSYSGPKTLVEANEAHTCLTSTQHSAITALMQGQKCQLNGYPVILGSANASPGAILHLDGNKLYLYLSIYFQSSVDVTNDSYYTESNLITKVLYHIGNSGYYWDGLMCAILVP